MSTHITAYRANRPVEELSDAFLELQALVRASFYAQYVALLAKTASQRIDGISFKDISYYFCHAGDEAALERLDELAPLRAARIALDKVHEQSRKTLQRTLDLDLDCNLSFVVDTEDRSCFYVLPHAESRSYHHLLDGVAWLYDHSYQNAVDKPDAIAEEDWEARKELWNRIIPHTAAEVALSWKVIGFWPPSFHAKPDVEEILGALPSVEQRRDELIRREADRKVTGCYHPDKGFNFREYEKQAAALREELAKTMPMPAEITAEQLGSFG